MKSVLLLFASIAGVALVASCSDDPVSSGGGPQPVPTYHASVESLRGIFWNVCGAGDDVYATGTLILHHDHDGWKALEPPPDAESDFRIAEGFSDGRLVVGDGSGLWVLKDGAWSDISGPHPDQIWGSSVEDLYALSYNGLSHYDGTSWSDISLPVPKYDPQAISGRASNDVVIAGYRGLIARYDGTQWTVSHIDSLAAYQSVAVSSSGRVFVRDSDRVSEVVNGVPLLLQNAQLYVAAMCADGDTLYVAGQPQNQYQQFVIQRYAGGTWTTAGTGEGRLVDVWAQHGRVFAGSDDSFLWRGTADGGHKELAFPKRAQLLDAASIDGAVFAIGEGAFRYENGQWTDLDKEYITKQPAWNIAGRSRDDIYAVGDEMILHYDGQKWSWVNSAFGERPSAIWVEPNGHVLAVGFASHAIQFDGTTWSKVDLPSNVSGLEDVWGAGDTIFAVGECGLIAMRTHGQWNVFPPPTTANLRAVWGLDAQHVYAVSSYSNEICVYDGHRWEQMGVGGAHLNQITSIWGTSPSDLFILNYYGHLEHFDGHNWFDQDRVFSTGMSALGGSGRDLLAVGYPGAVSYRP